jgi:hypothetical protein
MQAFDHPGGCSQGFLGEIGSQCFPGMLVLLLVRATAFIASVLTWIQI